MGWGKGGKGKAFGPGFGPHGHHHHHGPGLLGVAATAAVVGGVTAAVVASTVSRPARPRPRQEVVIINGTAPQSQPVYVSSQPAYVSQGYVIRGEAAKGYGKGKGKGKNILVATPDAPLDVMNVRLPPQVIEVRSGVTYFGVDVTPQSGTPWRVLRRYSEFLALRDRLGPTANAFPGAGFPGKSLLGCSGLKLEDRRRCLELWLQRGIENPASAGVWIKPLRTFLEAGKQMLAPVPVASATNPSDFSSTQALALLANMQPIAGAPEGSAPEAPAPEAAAQSFEDEGMLLEIDVPDGVYGGQLLGVTVPDGRQLTVPVPEGLAPGLSLQLWYDPALGTLQPVN